MLSWRWPWLRWRLSLRRLQLWSLLFPRERPVENGHALVAQLELRAVLRAFRDLELVRLAQGRHFDLAAQSGLRHIQRDGAVQVVFVALEERVILHLEEHVEIAGRAAVTARLAFAGQAEAVAVIHPGRDVDLELALHLAVTVALTFGARVADDLAASVARAARAANRQEALLVEHFAAAVAGGAVARPAARFAAPALAALAALHARHLDFRAHAEHGVLKAQFQIVAHVLAALRARALASAAGIAEKVAEAEEIAQDVAEIGEGFRIVAGRAAGALHAGMAETIVGGALLRIAQHAICLAGFLEFLFRARVVRIAVGMIPLGQFPVSAFDLLIAGFLADAEYFVIISFRHGIHCAYGLTATLTIAGLRSFPLKLYPRWNSPRMLWSSASSVCTRSTA